MISQRQYKALRWAVGRAEEWRGAEIGNPDVGPLLAFDKEVAVAKTALKNLRRAIPATNRGGRK